MSKVTKNLQQAVPLCAALLLLGCTAPKEAPAPANEPVKVQQTMLPFSVQPQSPHSELRDALQAELKRDPLFLGTHARDAGQIILSASPQVQVDPLMASKAPSFGKLAAKKTPFEIRVPYTLSMYRGAIIHSGEVRYLTDPIAVVSPALETKPDIPSEIWEDISSLILTDAAPSLEGQSWQASVVGLIDKDHAILNIGVDSTVPVRSVLESLDKPSTFAEIVVYESNDRGTSRAVIKHLSGPPLQVSMPFIQHISSAVQ